jgi:enamine deaminase RidA (YjgF/YER057c/UK114 family)
MASEQSPRRRVLGVPGIEHQNPIPQAVEIGGLVFSSAIFGEDPATGEIPDDPARQTELAFGHMRTMLEQAGAGPEAVAKLTVFLSDDANRAHVNREWLAMFPDEDDRPARHTVRADLRRGMLVQLEFIAVIAHGGPITTPEAAS